MMEEVEMKAGPDLDALVAEKVMRKVVIREPDHYLKVAESGGDFFGTEHVSTVLVHNQTFSRHRPGQTIAICPGYSTSIAAAWSVLERVTIVAHLSPILAHNNSGWQVSFLGNSELFTARSDTAPHAICLAALKAVEAG